MRSVVCLLVCGLLLNSDLAFSATKKKATPKLVLPVPTTKGSFAVGRPSAGALYGALKIPMKGKAIGVLPDHRGRNRNYATEALVKLLTAASTDLLKSDKRRVLVGDLSAKRGGKISGHASHQNGLDADLALFYVNAKGKPVEAKKMVALDDAGVSKNKKLSFDATTTWRLVAGLLQHPEVQVQYIFLYEPLKVLLLEAAKNDGASDALLEMAGTIVRQPSDSSLHDDHLHLRIYCPEDPESLCEDTGPIWSWVTLQKEAE
jgi:penicillin-insensitive murein DD-endopeptidase